MYTKKAWSVALGCKSCTGHYTASPGSSEQSSLSWTLLVSWPPIPWLACSGTAPVHDTVGSKEKRRREERGTEGGRLREEKVA